MNRLLVLLSATLVLLSASAARADTAGISFTSPGNSINIGAGFSLGFVFTATSSFAVDSLGYYDNGGLTEIHQVGLYNSSRTLLASATVTGTGTQVGFFNYTAISDVDLIAGQTYQVVGTSGLVDPYTFKQWAFPPLPISPSIKTSIPAATPSPSGRLPTPASLMVGSDPTLKRPQHPRSRNPARWPSSVPVC